MSFRQTDSTSGKLSLRFYPWFLRNVFLPVGDRVFGHGMMNRLQFLEKAQWWDSERLYDRRNRSLALLIRIAYQEVPFYRNIMNAVGIKPEDVQSPEDLYKLPVVTKGMLRESYPKLNVRNTGGRTYETYTSGSTGMNFCVKEDDETAGRYRASFLLALEWAGFRIGEPHLQTGMNLNRNFMKRLKDGFFRCHYVSAFDLSDVSLDTALERIERHSLGHLWGYPGSLYFLARRALEKGWNMPLSSVVTWGDNLHQHYRRVIENAFRTRVFDTYGCGEGMQIAAQCGDTNAYHIHSLDVIVECLDDEGNRLPPGRQGNLILTRLHPGPMPLIRYRIGDVGVLGEKKSCGCGRGFDIMDSVLGRDTDFIVTPSGNRLIVHFFTGILEYFQEVDSFQVVQEDASNMILRLVPAKGFSKDTAERIVVTLKERGASDMNIEIEILTGIPCPPSGKRRFVISKIAGTPGHS